MKSTVKKNIAIQFILFLVATIIIMVPLYYLFVTTFKTTSEALANPLGLPQNPTIENYVEAWKAMQYPRVLKNNVVMTGVSVIGIIFICAPAAYSIARRNHRLNRFLYFAFLSGLIVPFQLALIPLYKISAVFNLIDNLGGIIVIQIMIHIPFSIFLFRSFINTIPIELEQAASIDGCGVFRTFWSIVFPLLKPVISTVAILNALWIWNDFLMPLLFLSSRENTVMTLEVQRHIGQFLANWTVIFPIMVLSILPFLIFYLFMQQYIIKGIASGSLKS